MNANLLNMVMRITAEQGEGILGDPERLKSFIKDYAKDEPKEDRVAFGRCIERGFYRQIKAAKTVDERRRLKADLARQLQAATGLSAARCSGAIDILDAAVSLPAASYPSAPQQGQSAASTAAGAGALSGTISRKTLIFGAAGCAGAFAGELVSEIFRVNEFNSVTFWGAVGNVALWVALIGLGISAGLLTAQSVYLKKKPVAKTLIKTAVIGILLGALAGGAAQIIFAFTNNISTLAEVISRVICWGIAGWGVGWGVSTFVPNFPKKRAMLAGFLGGFAGGAVFRATFSLPFSGVAGRIIGVMILGLLIGLTISFIEEALREAWLTVIWGPKETMTVSLGQKPVVFGSSREADVFLSQRRGQPEIPPVCAIVGIEGGRVIIDDRVTGTRRELRNGDTADLGRVNIVANIKTGK
jgi:Ca-activated chloride channel family protein